MSDPNSDKARSRTAMMIVAAIVVALLFAFGIYYILHQQRQLEAVAEQSAIDMQLLQEDYSELALQYEEYRFTVSNDSLASKLATEQAKVQRLLEELRSERQSSAARITELKKELTTLRAVLRSYVEQIDSLNRANQALRTENKAVREEISRVTSQRQQLQERTEQLSEQVQLAAKLSVSSAQVQGLNARGKATKNLKNIKQLQVTFTIDRNITAEPGYKTVYLRLSKPDGTLMQSPDASGTFPFEGGQVPFSISRDVEYEGEPVQMTMYWDVREYLVEGTYSIEFFADGYLIGRTSFGL